MTQQVKDISSDLFYLLRNKTNLKASLWHWMTVTTQRGSSQLLIVNPGMIQFSEVVKEPASLKI